MNRQIAPAASGKKAASGRHAGLGGRRRTGWVAIALALLATAAGCQSFLGDLFSNMASTSYSDPTKYRIDQQRYSDLRSESDRPRPLR